MSVTKSGDSRAARPPSPSRFSCYALDATFLGYIPPLSPWGWRGERSARPDHVIGILAWSLYPSPGWFSPTQQNPRLPEAPCYFYFSVRGSQVTDYIPMR